ncbi:DUF4062 domain-containing protein [Fibrella sp. WM1]|uniref:DUF4062 domain-containing protein n=1 Tax=Fibrella musci TaxID=3242485 RepID=UPI00351FBB82
MALLKAFVSSTCYDLNILRTQLRAYLQSLGHEPIMSDYNDVLFDPRTHTHESCVQEISSADVVILIIGSRYGGTAVPNAVNSLDIEGLKSLSKNSKLLDRTDKISITQLEILKAIESDIPIFTFVDSRVMHDHLFYEKNKDKGFLDSLEFPSIEKKDSAVFIFEFINFIRLRSKNNSVIEFNKLSDIEDFLRRQWSALLQKLLFEQRRIKSESRRLEAFSEELKDIKSLILSSISTGQAKDVGRGVLRYRRLIEFLISTKHKNVNQIIVQELTWDTLLEALDIVSIITNDNHRSNHVYLLKSDGTFYQTRYNLTAIRRLALDWSSFSNLALAVKQEVVSALSENIVTNEISVGPLYYKDKLLEEYLKEKDAKKDANNMSTTINSLTFDKTVETSFTNNEEEEEEE